MNRREYTIIISSAFIMGFIIYGIMATVTKEELNVPLPHFVFFLKSGLMGGLLIGGIISGILLFTSFLKKKSTGFKVLCVVFFPLTFACICYVGILGGIPYYIYNIKMQNKRNKVEPTTEGADTINQDQKNQQD